MSLLELKNVTKRCPDGFTLEDISFEISEKGIYAFLGNSRSGKSMLAELICGATDFDEGEMLFKGKNIADKSVSKSRKMKIGYVPQNNFFPVDMTVCELLDFTGRIKKVDPDKRVRQIKEALELTGLFEKSDIIILNLTPSERKRVAYANALLGNPDIIVIDDPISAVDPAQREEIKKILVMLGKVKVVILFASKGSDLEELFKTVGILDDGKLLVYEQTDALLSKINKNFNALLRVRINSNKLSDMLSAIRSVDEVISASTLYVSTISDIKIECLTRESVTLKVTECAENFGAEIVSLRFTSFCIDDVVDAFCSEPKKEE